MAENWTPRVKRILLDAGCGFVRQGRGDHEIWHSPRTGRFMVDNSIKTRRWALVTLKKAGIDNPGLLL
jgi:hypothetical protein